MPSRSCSQITLNRSQPRDFTWRAYVTRLCLPPRIRRRSIRFRSRRGTPRRSRPFSHSRVEGVEARIPASEQHFLEYAAPLGIQADDFTVTCTVLVLVHPWCSGIRGNVDTDDVVA